MSAIVIAGDTSGTCTLQANAVAGTVVLTLPTTSGTLVSTTTPINASSITSGTLAVAYGGTGGNDAATARTNLGLGTVSTQNSNNVSITGGSITGITDLAVADGGTGVSTIAANAVVLGNGTSAVQTVAPGTNGNVLTSNGTTWTSTAPGGVTSLNGQTGAITNTSVNAIGSYTAACSNLINGAILTPGSTVSGSDLRMFYGGTGPGDSFQAYYSGNQYNPGFTGTWRAMAASKNQAAGYDNFIGVNLFVRVS